MLNLIITITWCLPISIAISNIYNTLLFFRAGYFIQFALMILSVWTYIYQIDDTGFFFWSPFSFVLVLCTIILTLVCYMIIEFRIDSRIQMLLFCIFLIQSISITFFTTQNLFIFYILFELVLIPFFLIIIGWGSAGKNIKAALYFFFYTYLASLPMLFGLIFIYLKKQILWIYCLRNLSFEHTQEVWLWLAFFIAFAAKLAIPPLHLWLVEAHVEAPTIGSVLLSGIALKVGLYGFVTILPTLFTTTHFQLQDTLFPLILLTFLYIIMVFMAQLDLKKIIAYLSIIHMVLILLGIFSNTIEGFQGAILMSITHSFVSPALFCCVGFLYDRYENRSTINFGGLAKLMPILSTFMFFLFLVEIGFPLTINFIGELLIFKGIFDFMQYFIFIMCVPYVLLAAIIFKTFSAMFFGALPYELASFTDITVKESCVLLVQVMPLITAFLFPQLVLDLGEVLFYTSNLYYYN